MNPQLPLSGMMIFTTADVAEALTGNTTARSGLSVTVASQERHRLAEEHLFAAIRRGLTARQRSPHPLLRSFPGKRCGTGATRGTNETSRPYVCLPKTRHDNADCMDAIYVMNLDHVYRTPEGFLERMRECWAEVSSGITDEEENNTCATDPDLLLIVLSPAETHVPLGPGSMLPSFIRVTSNTTYRAEEKGMTERRKDKVEMMPPNDKKGAESVEFEGDTFRLCGFPPSLRFHLSLTHQKLWLDSIILGSQYSTKDCNGFRAMFFSSDFIIHSLFFLDWCVPSDFVWSPRQAPRKVGWGCDIMGRLLRGINKQPATELVPSAETEKVSLARGIIPYCKNVTATEEFCILGDMEEESLFDVENSFPSTMAPSTTLSATGIEHTNSKRKENRLQTENNTMHHKDDNGNSKPKDSHYDENEDVRFVQSLCAKVTSSPRRQLAISVLLDELRMVTSVHHSQKKLSKFAVPNLFSLPLPVSSAARCLLEEKQSVIPTSRRDKLSHPPAASAENASFLQSLAHRWSGGEKDHIQKVSQLLEGPSLAVWDSRPSVELADVVELNELSFTNVESCASFATSKNTAGPAAATTTTTMAKQISSNVADGECLKRILRGLESQMFFVDAALTAADLVIAQRWTRAMAQCSHNDKKHTIIGQ